MSVHPAILFNALLRWQEKISPRPFCFGIFAPGHKIDNCPAQFLAEKDACFRTPHGNDKVICEIKSTAKAESPFSVPQTPSAFHLMHVFAQPNSNRASCASASVTAEDDSYTRVPRYQVLSYLSFPPADKKR